MSVLVLVIIILLCILLEGFFSGSEIAVVCADKYRLALATDAKSKRALFALHLIKRPAKFFSTTILGTNLCVVTASVLSSLYIIERYGEAYAPFALLLWPFVLILGELVPKSIYQHNADRIVLFVAPILFAFSVLFFPIVWLLSKITEMLLGTVKRASGSSAPITREELAMILETSTTDKSDVMQSERTLISRIFNLADRRVQNIMTPLVDVVALPSNAAREEVEAVLEKQGYSRVPIYEGQAFNIIGVLVGTDLLFADPSEGVRDLVRKVYYVPDEMPLDELLVAMKRKGESIAVAVDEYGAATGIVTVEDLLEDIVGDIRDEHDDDQTFYRRLGKYHYAVSGRMGIAEANDKLKLEIPMGDYETIAGFVLHKLEHIPKIGKAFAVGQFEYKVVRSTERAVLEVEITRKV